MKKLAVILLVLALPAVSFAQSEVVTPGTNPTAKSAVASDILHTRAHICLTGNSTCGPDNLVSSPFGALIQLFVPTTQTYTRLYVFTDIEGNVVNLVAFGSVIPAGFTTFSLNGVNLPGSGSVATRGLYKFISLVIGDDGRIAFSDYYRFRVIP